MAAMLADLKNWFEYGVSHGWTHMIVVCENDAFDLAYYPVYVERGQNPRDVARKNDSLNHTKRVMEVYDLRQPADDQFNNRYLLVFNYGDDFPPQEELPIDTWF